jgi:hypothetical protein
MAIPGYWQSHSLIKIDDDSCSHFWKIQNDRNIRSREEADTENNKLKENWNNI